MKIRIISDLHVDLPAKNGQTFGFEDKLNETNLVLIAGDISNSKQGVIQYLDNLKTSSSGDSPSRWLSSTLGTQISKGKPRKDK